MQETTKIKIGRAPVLDKLYEKIPSAQGQQFYLAYDHTIYGANKPPEELIVHEEVHFKQQDEYSGTVDEWWDRYLDDVEFRLEAEIEAYATQVAYHKSDSARGKCLAWASRAISGPLYGELLDYQDAREALKKELANIERANSGAAGSPATSA